MPTLLEKLKQKADQTNSTVEEGNLLSRLQGKVRSDPTWTLPAGYTDDELEDARIAIDLSPNEQSRETNRQYYEWLVAEKKRTISELQNKYRLGRDDLPEAVKTQEEFQRVMMQIKSIDKKQWSEKEKQLMERISKFAEKGPIGFWESFWDNPLGKLPFSAYDAGKLARDKLTTRAYERLPDPRYLPKEYLTPKQWSDIEATRKIYEQYLEDRALEQLEKQMRGQTIGGKIGGVVSELPAFMTEFAVTGGAAAEAKKTGRRAAMRLLGSRLVFTKPGRLAVGLAGRLPSAATRALLMPHRVAAGTLERVTPDILLDQQARLVFGAEDDGWAMAFLKSYTDVVIENFSEEIGDVLGTTARGAAKKAGKLLEKFPRAKGAVAKISNGLKDAWLKANPARTADDFFRIISERVGFHGVLEEVGEERVGDVLRETLGIGKSDDPNMFKRLMAAIPSGEQLMVELISFSFPGAARHIGSAMMTPPSVEETLRNDYRRTLKASLIQNRPVSRAALEPYALAGEKWAKKAIKKLNEDSPTVANLLEAGEDNAPPVQPAIPIEAPPAEAPALGAEAKQPWTSTDSLINSAFSSELIQKKGEPLALAKEFVAKYKGNAASIEKMAPVAMDRADNKGKAKVRAVLKELARQTVKTPEITKPPGIEPPAHAAAEVPQIPAEEPAPPVEKPYEETSARQADMTLDRAALGLDVVDSKERRSWQTALETARSREIPLRAERLAAEVNHAPRPLNDIETAGLVDRAAWLKREHRNLIKRTYEVEDEAEILSISAEIWRIESEFDVLSRALITSGTEKGRALASQKLTLNEDFDLISIKARAKAAKGKPLTARQEAKLTELTSRLETSNAEIARLQQHVNELQARSAIRNGVRRRYAGTSSRFRNTERAELTNKLRQLLAAGCYK